MTAITYEARFTGATVALIKREAPTVVDVEEKYVIWFIEGGVEYTIISAQPVDFAEMRKLVKGGFA